MKHPNNHRQLIQTAQINEALLQQLVDMGFSVEGCKRALINTGNNDVEAAMNWVFEHQGDPDFDTPYQAPSKKARMDKTPVVEVSRNRSKFDRINVSFCF